MITQKQLETFNILTLLQEKKIFSQKNIMNTVFPVKNFRLSQKNCIFATE